MDTQGVVGIQIGHFYSNTTPKARLANRASIKISIIWKRMNFFQPILIRRKFSAEVSVRGMRKSRVGYKVFIQGLYGDRKLTVDRINIISRSK